jgi:hypothetical protein
MPKQEIKKRFTNVIWEGAEADLPPLIKAELISQGEEITSQTQAIKIACYRYLQYLKNGKETPQLKKENQNPLFG